MLLLRYCLWIVPNLLCGAALIIAYRKGVHKTLPAFVSLLALAFLNFCVLLVVGLVFPQPVYKWCVVADTVATFVIELVVVYELLSVLVTSRSSLALIFRPLPQWTAGILTLVAVAGTALLRSSAMEQVMTVFRDLDFGLNLIAVGMLFSLVLFTRVLGVSWRSVPAGIALGLGIDAVANVAVAPLLSQWGKAGYIAVDIIRMSAFQVCVLVWCAYLFLPETVSRTRASNLEVSNLELHLKELQRMMER
jgi:hypothetical protein